MERNKKPPISWKLEEYAFGAAALREEIKRHKKEDHIPWNPVKAIWIRGLYIYAISTTVLLVIWIMLKNSMKSLRKSN